MSSYQSAFSGVKPQENVAYLTEGGVLLNNDNIHRQKMATVLCCNCGVPIDGTAGVNMCYDCIKLSVDITEGLQRESTLNFCRNCERFLRPPNQWVTAALESRELLALCLKKLKGLNKVKT